MSDLLTRADVYTRTGWSPDKLARILRENPTLEVVGAGRGMQFTEQQFAALIAAATRRGTTGARPMRSRVNDFGLIYVVQGAPETPVKIGFSTEAGMARRLIALQVGNHAQLRIIARSQGYMRDEKRAHTVLVHDRLVGEWFNWSARTAAFVRALGGGIAEAIATARAERVK